VQPVGGGALAELDQQGASQLGAAAQWRRRRAFEPLGQARPMRGELAGRRVELAQGAVLRRI
jgi:hypothetical protein